MTRLCALLYFKIIQRSRRRRLDISFSFENLLYDFLRSGDKIEINNFFRDFVLGRGEILKMRQFVCKARENLKL